MRKLKWLSHADLAIRKSATVGREEYLDRMTFKGNKRPLFTEISGPIVALKEEREEQGRYRQGAGIQNSAYGEKWRLCHRTRSPHSQ